jgi:hypothetical protein
MDWYRQLSSCGLVLAFFESISFGVGVDATDDSLARHLATGHGIVIGLGSMIGAGIVALSLVRAVAGTGLLTSGWTSAVIVFGVLRVGRIGLRSAGGHRDSGSGGTPDMTVR